MRFKKSNLKIFFNHGEVMFSESSKIDVSVFSSVNNVVGERVRKSHIKIINSARLYRYKGGKICGKEGGRQGKYQ